MTDTANHSGYSNNISFNLHFLFEFPICRSLQNVCHSIWSAEALTSQQALRRTIRDQSLRTRSRAVFTERSSFDFKYLKQRCYAVVFVGVIIYQRSQLFLHLTLFKIESENPGINSSKKINNYPNNNGYNFKRKCD